VGLADADRSTLGLGHIDDAQVDAADVRAVVVEQAQERGLRMPVGRHLFIPLAAQTTHQVAVRGVDMATDADRPAVVKASVATATGALHEEEPSPVAQQQIRDDLLPGGVVLGLGPGPVGSLRRDDGKVAADVPGRHAPPRGVAQDALARDAQDELVGRGLHVDHVSASRCASPDPTEWAGGSGHQEITGTVSRACWMRSWGSS